jgi:hypothetical protein
MMLEMSGFSGREWRGMVLYLRWFHSHTVYIARKLDRVVQVEKGMGAKGGSRTYGNMPLTETNSDTGRKYNRKYRMLNIVV